MAPEGQNTATFPKTAFQKTFVIFRNVVFWPPQGLRTLSYFLGTKTVDWSFYRLPTGLFSSCVGSYNSGCYFASTRVIDASKTQHVIAQKWAVSQHDMVRLFCLGLTLPQDRLQPLRATAALGSNSCSFLFFNPWLRWKSLTVKQLQFCSCCSTSASPVVVMQNEAVRGTRKSFRGTKA